MPPSIAELTQRFLRTPSSEAAGGVEPYDVSSAFRVEPATAWSETLVVLKSLGVSPLPKMPSDWAAHVRQQPSVRLLPMAAGHFPQMVSELDRVLADKSAASNGSSVKFLVESDANTINEAAVALWNAGRLTDARAKWATLTASPLRAFNLGVAALALGDHSEAAAQLKIASVQIPDSSGWRSLSEIYLALTELKH